MIGYCILMKGTESLLSTVVNLCLQSRTGSCDPCLLQMTKLSLKSETMSLLPLQSPSLMSMFLRSMTGCPTLSVRRCGGIDGRFSLLRYSIGRLCLNSSSVFAPPARRHRHRHWSHCWGKFWKQLPWFWRRLVCSDRQRPSCAQQAADSPLMAHQWPWRNGWDLAWSRVSHWGRRSSRQVYELVG